MNPIELFLSNFAESLSDGRFLKLTLGKFRGDPAGLEHVYVRMVTFKTGSRLNFVHRYPDHDLTQNYPVSEGLALVRDWLGKSSWAATLFTVDQRQQLLFNRRGLPRLSTSSAENVETRPQHDREKQHLLQDETFLRHLGILDSAGHLRSRMNDKYRQIHHFVELLAPALRRLPIDQELRVVDMGSGKGYLTFATYAFLQQEGLKPAIVGIEKRQALVDLCNQVAARSAFSGLRFEPGEISAVRLEGVDVIMALHACDTATDEAIYRGIASGAKLMFLAPCCHQELRPQLVPPNHLAPLFKDGIQAERMAEALTDTLRCMYLEASGYSTTIQEFIALEHTKEEPLDQRRKNLQTDRSGPAFSKGVGFSIPFRHQAPTPRRFVATRLTRSALPKKLNHD